MIIRRHGLILSAFAGLLLATGAQAQTTPASTPAASAAQSPPGAGFGRMTPDSTNIVKLATAINQSHFRTYLNRRRTI
jgi:hypothetical protein